MIKETARSEMYFKDDIRRSSVLCIASRYLGMAICFAELDSIILASGQSSLKLTLTRQLHINNRVYYGCGAEKDSITFLQKGPYYNRADVTCQPFVLNGEEAPAESRFEISCVGDIVSIYSGFMIKQDSDVAVAVIRLKGGDPCQEDGKIYYTINGKRIYVLPSNNSVIELNGDELIVKQPIMSVAGEDGNGVGLRFCATESLLFTAPPLAIYVEARRGAQPLRAELDKVHSVYLVNDERGTGDIEFYLENPFDRPICMPVLFTRRHSSQMGATVYTDSRQSGIPVQICCERIRRGNDRISYYDYTVAPVIPARTRVGFELKFTDKGCANHLWTHGKENQLARIELFKDGCECLVDLMRSLRSSAVPSIKYGDMTHRMDLVRIIKNDSRMDMTRVRLTDIFCGELEAYARQQLCTPGREIRADIRVGMISFNDYPRVSVSISLEADEDFYADKICLLSIEGRNFYVGNDTSVSYIASFEGEGLRYTQSISDNEFAGFDSIAVVARECNGKAEARLYACEDGESYSRLEICCENGMVKGEKRHFEFAVCLLPDAQGEKRERIGAGSMTDGQLMRREAAANNINTVAIVGEGTGVIKAKGNYAEAMQSGGLGLCAIRFCSLEDISTIGVVSDSGHRLPVQAELDKRGGYKLLALFENSEKITERMYYLK